MIQIIQVLGISLKRNKNIHLHKDALLNGHSTLFLIIKQSAVHQLVNGWNSCGMSTQRKKENKGTMGTQ